MSKLSLKQAAEFAETTKPTILKHIKKGRVSGEKDTNGQWWFDIAELVRAYGEPSSRTTSGTTSINKRNPIELIGETPPEMATHRELSLLREERERERQQYEATISDLRRRLDDESEERRRTQQQLAGLLTDQRQQIVPPRPRGFLDWLLNRAPQ